MFTETGDQGPATLFDSTGAYAPLDATRIAARNDPGMVTGN